MVSRDWKVYSVGAETPNGSTFMAALRYLSKSPRGLSVLGCLSNFQATPRGFFVPLGGQRG